MNGYFSGSGKMSLLTAWSILIAMTVPHASGQVPVRGPINNFRRVKLSQAGRQTQLAPTGSFQDIRSVPPPQPAATTDSAAATKDEKKEEALEAKKEKSRKVRGDAPCLCWVKAGVPTQAVVLCIHGLGLNSSSWEQLGQRLSERGVVTYAIDVRGFGSWMEAKGHHNVDFKACMQDVRTTLEWIRRANPGKPVFLLGESMGGAIALQFTAEYPSLIDGLISACASGDRFKQKKMDLKVGLHMLRPGGMRRDFNVGSSIINQATDNAELKADWEGDPLNRMKLSPDELIQFQKFMNENHEKAKLITHTPVLIVQGSKDGLVKPEGTEELFNEIATRDKELLMVPNGEHLIFEEGQFTEEVMRSVASWVIRHAPQLQQARMAAARQRRGQRAAGGRRAPGPLAEAMLANQQGPFQPPAGVQPPQGTPPFGPPPGGPVNWTPTANSNGYQSGPQSQNGEAPGSPNIINTPQAVAQLAGTGNPGTATIPGAAPDTPDASSQNTGVFAAVPGQFIAQAKQLMAEGKYKLAQRTLEAELRMAPNSPEANYLLGQTYLQMQNYKLAHHHLRNAVRNGAGTNNAAQANQALMNMPRNVLAPRLMADGSVSPGGTQPMQGARRPRRNSVRSALQQQGPQPPTVIVFNAKWSEPGKDMAKIVEETQQRYPGVTFIQIDVDDPKNSAMLDKYDIGPVPTTVFLNSAGSVADFCVGYAGIDGMINGMSKILPGR
ncbi:MAG: alpha/beta fold hydrolase [Candidatus Obscuribacterales bacterium]|nr:alpha/beta fold hydrolase [Candidatus Obscuribacterales bacterium]